MQLPNYIKPYPKFITWLLPHFGGNSIYPFIFLRQDIYNGLTSDQPNSKYLATLAHELHHRQRQQKSGWLRWGCLYLTSRTFRFEEELSAYKVTMSIRKHYKEDFNINYCAKVLSGPMYLWSTSYGNAFMQLEEAWGKTKPISPEILIQLD